MIKWRAVERQTCDYQKRGSRMTLRYYKCPWIAPSWTEAVMFTLGMSPEPGERIVCRTMRDEKPLGSGDRDAAAKV